MGGTMGSAATSANAGVDPRQAAQQLKTDGFSSDHAGGSPGGGSASFGGHPAAAGPVASARTPSGGGTPASAHPSGGGRTASQGLVSGMNHRGPSGLAGGMPGSGSHSGTLTSQGTVTTDAGNSTVDGAGNPISGVNPTAGYVNGGGGATYSGTGASGSTGQTQSTGGGTNSPSGSPPEGQQTTPTSSKADIGRMITALNARIVNIRQAIAKPGVILVNAMSTKYLVNITQAATAAQAASDRSSQDEVYFRQTYPDQAIHDGWADLKAAFSETGDGISTRLNDTQGFLTTAVACTQKLINQGGNMPSDRKAAADCHIAADTGLSGRNLELQKISGVGPMIPPWVNPNIYRLSAWNSVPNNKCKAPCIAGRKAYTELVRAALDGPTYFGVVPTQLGKTSLWMNRGSAWSYASQATAGSIFQNADRERPVLEKVKHDIDVAVLPEGPEKSEISRNLSDGLLNLDFASQYWEEAYTGKEWMRDAHTGQWISGNTIKEDDRGPECARASAKAVDVLASLMEAKRLLNISKGKAK